MSTATLLPPTTARPTTTPAAYVPAPPAPALTATGLRRRVAKRWVVDGVSLSVGAGEIVGLLGPNGAGKTVTFYLLAGLLRPAAGSIVVDGVDVTDRSMTERAHLGVAYLPQEPSAFRGLSAEENVALVLECNGVGRREARRQARAVLDEFGLLHLASTSAARLSGGERRRLEVARAVALSPRFLLLDEPFAGVDPITVEMVSTLLRDLKRRGIGILLTDHNVRDTLALVDRAYVLFDGRLLAQGSAAELAGNPAVREHFLGPETVGGADDGSAGSRGIPATRE